MCGRYKQTSSAEPLKTLFGIANVSFDTCGIVSPTMKAPVIRGDNVEFLSWGYVPSWTKDASSQKLINARAETLGEKPSFRESLQSRRCLVPADSFFEWSTEATQKRAYEINLESNSPFAFAGIWDAWKNPATGEVVESFAIITQAADETVSKIHNRMPVILTEREDFARWLSKPDLDFEPPRLAITPVEIPKRAVGDTRQMPLF